VLYSFKFKTKGAEAVYRVIFSDHMQSPGRHNKLNPINSMRTGEEMEMLV